MGRRESHDATSFYARFSAPEVSDADRVAEPSLVDSILCHDARDMDRFVADDSVALVVTSPPYFAGKAYEEALGEGVVPADYNEYRTMLFDVFEQCRAKLEPGGRIAVNVANLGRKPYRSLSADVIDIFEQLGFLLRGEIIWQKSHAAGGSCAWGTYQRPGNPVLRDITERIIVASKGRFDRARSPEQRLREGRPNEGSIFMDDFVDATTDVWDIPAESATRIGHPAPFPVELPRRLTELYTYRGDLVLDPFIGAGTTAVAAVRTERHYIGFDTDQAYIDLATKRIAAERERIQQRGDDVRRVVVPPVRPRPSVDDDKDDFQVRAVRDGQRARELALQVLHECDFDDIDEAVRYGDLGVEVNFRACDHRGKIWLFDVSGAFSSTRPGLKRTDTLWKALGKAAVLHEARQSGPNRSDLGPLVLLSTDIPARNSAGGKALASMTGPDRAIYEVIELLDSEGLTRLQRLARGSRAER